MNEWSRYVDDGDIVFKKKKKTTSLCKKNKITSMRYGRCNFVEDKCCFCNRPRKKVNKLNPVTGVVTTHYLE